MIEKFDKKTPIHIIGAGKGQKPETKKTTGEEPQSGAKDLLEGAGRPLPQEPTADPTVLASPEPEEIVPGPGLQGLLGKSTSKE